MDCASCGREFPEAELITIPKDLTRQYSATGFKLCRPCFNHLLVEIEEIHKDRLAPPGKFRVIGVDKFSNERWIVGDFDSKQSTREIVGKKTSEVRKDASSQAIATVYYSYDDKGNPVG